MKKHTTLKSKFNSAFSLVELLVVIAVIAVIAAIAIPNITGTREAAQAAVTASEQADADRFNAQIKAMGGTGGFTVTQLKEGRSVELDPDGTGPATAVTMTFKLD
jgi:prepilin-type N-terminal cleavage/methylation domain-containing protein